jgi:hypothetical protein
MNLSVIWRRRVVLMAIVGLVIAIPVTLLIRDSGEDEPTTSTEPDLDEELPLNPSVGDRQLDARYSVPKGWRLKRDGEVLTLRSPDKTVQIGISSPAPAGESEQVLDEAVTALKGAYESVKVSAGSGKKVGGLPAKGAVITARGDNVHLRIVVAAMAGDKKAYLVEVFTSASAPPESVAQAQRFLDSLRLRG